METRALRHAARRPAQAAVVEALGLAPTRVSALLGELERKRMITRAKSRGDRRHRTIELTPAGRGAIEQIDAHIARHSPLVRALDGDQFASLRSILLTMRAAQRSSPPRTGGGEP